MVSDARAVTAWRALCMSHDPALIVDPDSGGYTDLDALVDEIEQSRERSHSMHPDCDLIIGGFVLPQDGAGFRERLVTVACPGQVGVGEDLDDGRHLHERLITVDVPWLRIFAAVLRPPGTFVPSGDPLVDAMRQLPGCWSADRVRRLRPLLGVVVPRG